jgi:integrase
LFLQGRELRDLELDCVHQIDGHGAWLKVPLGKLASERMVPLDEETVAVIDRIVARRTPGRPLPHPRTGRPVDFLLVHQGRRLSACALREELARAADTAGLGKITPHALSLDPPVNLWREGCRIGVDALRAGKMGLV